MKSIEEALEETAAAIAAFMAIRTGYRNGYCTRVEGTVRKNVHSSLALDYPERADKTYKAVRNEGEALYRILYDLIGDEFLSVYHVRIVSEHEGDGCYSTV